MKNILKIKEHLTNTNIYICYGNEAYLTMNKKLNVSSIVPLNCNGRANEITYVDDNSLNCYLVGINNNYNNIYQVKATIVHELSHIVTYFMKYYGFDDDEFRSYLLAFLYEKTMIWFDKILSK